jgi:uncharacterized phage infection (PIP) family protein YhgE
MKPIHIIAFALLPFAAAGQIINLPRSIPQAADQASQAKRTIDDSKVEREAANQRQLEETRRRREEQYAAIEEREQRQETQFEIRNNYRNLSTEVEQLRNQLAEIHRQNTQLSTHLTTLSQEVETLKAANTNLRRAIEAQRPPETPPTAQKLPGETINMGDMAVSGNSSARRAPDGSLSLRDGNTHTTYTPRAAPLRRSQPVYHTGPRGGCFYYTGSGRKEYVDRSLCR